MPASSATTWKLHGEPAQWTTLNYQLHTLINMVGRRWAGKRWKPLPGPKSRQELEAEAPRLAVEERRRRLVRLRRSEAERHARREQRAQGGD